MNLCIADIYRLMYVQRGLNDDSYINLKGTTYYLFWCSFLFDTFGLHWANSIDLHLCIFLKWAGATRQHYEHSTPCFLFSSTIYSNIYFYTLYITSRIFPHQHKIPMQSMQPCITWTFLCHYVNTEYSVTFEMQYLSRISNGTHIYPNISNFKLIEKFEPVTHFVYYIIYYIGYWNLWNLSLGLGNAGVEF